MLAICPHEDWTDYTACVDFSAVNGGTMVAYRLSGKRRIQRMCYHPHVLIGRTATYLVIQYRDNRSTCTLDRGARAQWRLLRSRELGPTRPPLGSLAAREARQRSCWEPLAVHRCGQHSNFRWHGSVTSSKDPSTGLGKEPVAPRTVCVIPNEIS